jgi:hypothetical protein
MGVHLKETELTFRRKQTHPLKSLLKLTTKEVQDTIERLVALASSENEKIALAANSKIMDIHMDATNAIEKDDITRTLAEIKLNGPKQLEIEEDDTPLVDFTEIREAT